ncbi:hypothetical protein TNCV_3358761 [Trichonephila clavipes]|nr:hypothetical protein TNCV_3358761 [Trichonephila clavipes]
MQPGIVLFKYRVGCTLQQWQKNRFHNLCVVVVRCQTDVIVYQRHPGTKHYSTQTHDAWFDGRRNGLVLKVLRLTAIPVDGRHSSADRNKIHPGRIPNVIRWFRYDDDDTPSVV